MTAQGSPTETPPRAFLDDPVEHFDWSLTAMFTMPREQIDAWQLEGLRIRFDELRDRVAVLKRLADAQNVREVRTVDDVVPLLFDHSIYKAYPQGLLHENRWDLMPCNIEKIVAWGGFASVKHVTKYIQPGLELVSLDPKSSASFIGRECLATDHAMTEAAQRLAFDIGAVNQQGCVSARVVYVEAGDDNSSIDRLVKFGRLVLDRMVDLPEQWSTAPKNGIDPALKAELRSASLTDDWLHRHRRRGRRGCNRRVPSAGARGIRRATRRPRRQPRSRAVNRGHGPSS